MGLHSLAENRVKAPKPMASCLSTSRSCISSLNASKSTANRKQCGFVVGSCCLMRGCQRGCFGRQQVVGRQQVETVSLIQGSNSKAFHLIVSHASKSSFAVSSILATKSLPSVLQDLENLYPPNLRDANRDTCRRRLGADGWFAMV